MKRPATLASVAFPAAAKWLTTLLLACVFSTLASHPSFAGSASQEAEDGQATATSSELFGFGYSSPRECMAEFLESAGRYFPDQVSEAALERMLKALDLRELPEAERLSAAKQRAYELRETINRTDWVELDDLPGGDDPELRLGTTSVWARTPQGMPELQVNVRFERTPRGTWVIGAETLRRVPEWWQAIKDLDPVSQVLQSLSPFERLSYQLRTSMPDWMKQRTFIIENWQWVGLLLLIFLGVILDRLVGFVMTRVARRVQKSERLTIEKESMVNFERPLGLFVVALVFSGLLPILGIHPQIHHILEVAASLVLTVAGIWASFRLVDVICDYLKAKARRSDNTFDDMLVPLARRTMKILVAVMGLVFIASRLSSELWSILAGLSIGSLAIGFAAKDSIENLFGTFTVLLDKPFQLGDWVVVGDVEGTVEEVGFRSTRIRTFYNSLITIPNSSFISAHVDNMGVRRYRRIKTMLALTYDTPPEKVDAFCEGVREVIRIHPYTRKDYYHVYLNQLGSSSLDILLYCFVETPDWNTELREKHRLFNDILRLAESLKVSFAFPTQSVHLVKPEDLEHPDRPADSPSGEDRGRQAAFEVTEQSGAATAEKPGPVVIQKTPTARG